MPGPPQHNDNGIAYERTYFVTAELSVHPLLPGIMF
jgi:hypothetical protein